MEFSFRYYDGTNAAICGGIDLAGAPNYFRHHCTTFNGIYYCGYGSNITPVTISPYPGIDEDINCYIDPVTGSAKINSQNVSFAAITGSRTTGKNYGICGRIANTGAVQWKKNRFSFFRCWRGGTLLRDMVPCRRKADNKPGMYDLVSGTFFTSAGSEDFTAGPDVN